jgi:hypothetical protein
LNHDSPHFSHKNLSQDRKKKEKRNCSAVNTMPRSAQRAKRTGDRSNLCRIATHCSKDDDATCTSDTKTVKVSNRRNVSQTGANDDECRRVSYHYFCLSNSQGHPSVKVRHCVVNLPAYYTKFFVIVTLFSHLILACGVCQTKCNMEQEQPTRRQRRREIEASTINLNMNICGGDNIIHGTSDSVDSSSSRPRAARSIDHSARQRSIFEDSSSSGGSAGESIERSRALRSLFEDSSSSSGSAGRPIDRGAQRRATGVFEELQDRILQSCGTFGLGYMHSADAAEVATSVAPSSVSTARTVNEQTVRVNNESDPSMQIGPATYTTEAEPDPASVVDPADGEMHTDAGTVSTSLRQVLGIALMMTILAIGLFCMAPARWWMDHQDTAVGAAVSTEDPPGLSMAEPKITDQEKDAASVLSELLIAGETGKESILKPTNIPSLVAGGKASLKVALDTSATETFPLDNITVPAVPKDKCASEPLTIGGGTALDAAASATTPGTVASFDFSTDPVQTQEQTTVQDKDRKSDVIVLGIRLQI